MIDKSLKSQAVPTGTVWTVSPLLALVFAVAAAGGCVVGGTGIDSGASATDSSTTNTDGASASDSGVSGSDSSVAVSCSDPNAPDVWAETDVIDFGLGPQEATVTVHNCTGNLAYVYQDCCFGPAYALERLEADGSWLDIWPEVVCDCAGPVPPLEIEPFGQISFPTWPWDPDLCNLLFSATYRWELFVGDPSGTSTSIWTEEFQWYCEG